MNFCRIKKLTAIRDNYHPLINKLFRRYPSKIISVIMNLIVGLCCFVLLAAAFLSLAYFFSGYGNVNKILSVSDGMIFIFCFLTTIKSVYAFLFSGKDLNLLRSLPVTRFEIVASNGIYFYKKQILVSLYLISAALYGLMKFEPNWLQIAGAILSGLFIPLASISLSFFLAFLIHQSVKRIEILKIHSCLTFSKKPPLLSLLKFEIKNFRRFASLKMEIVMQIVFSVALTICAINFDIRYLAAIAVYPALSMINVSSFSREGEFHNMLETFPIDKVKRFMAKTLFYLLIELPILLICFMMAALKKDDMSILLLLIPSIFFLVSITMVGIKVDCKNPKIHWTNPQEAFQMNFVFLFASLFLGLLTEFATFMFGIWGMIAAIVINVFMLGFVGKNMKT